MRSGTAITLCDARLFHWQPCVQIGNIMNGRPNMFINSKQGVSYWLADPRFPSSLAHSPPVMWALTLTTAVQAGHWSLVFKLLQQAGPVQAALVHATWLEVRSGWPRQLLGVTVAVSSAVHMAWAPHGNAVASQFPRE